MKHSFSPVAWFNAMIVGQIVVTRLTHAQMALAAGSASGLMSASFAALGSKAEQSPTKKVAHVTEAFAAGPYVQSAHEVGVVPFRPRLSPPMPTAPAMAIDLVAANER